MKSAAVIVIVLKASQEKNFDERKSWGFMETYEVAITISPEGSADRLKLKDWLAIDARQFTKPLVIVYSDDALDANRAESKSKLREIAGNNVRVWDHGGEFNLKVNLDSVRQRFDGKGFKDAGFTRDVPVMPFSTGTRFPWNTVFERAQGEIKRVANGGLTETADVNRLSDYFEAAWNTAACFYSVELPAQCLLESFFPLYVDLQNHQVEGITTTDLGASIAAGKKELEFRLAHLKQPLEGKTQSDVESLKIRFGVIKDSPECAPQKLAKPGWALLEAMESLRATQGIQEFILKFRLFSEAYSASLGLETQTGSGSSKTLTPPT